MKRFFLISLLIVLIFSQGCNLPPELKPTEDGSLIIEVTVPPVLLEVSGLEAITLQALNFKVTKDQIQLEKQVIIDEEGLVEVAFDGMGAGNWTVLVEAEDTDGYLVFTGGTTATITAGETTTVGVVMALTSGDLQVEIHFPDTLNVTGGLVRLFDPHTEDPQQELNIVGNSGFATFTDLRPGGWEITITLYEGQNTVFSDFDVLDVLPGRTTLADITIEGADGNLLIVVDWVLYPAKAANLNCSYSQGAVDLTWDQQNLQDVLGFRVFRSESASGPKLVLNSELITETAYRDQEVVAGATYWYWVLTYMQDGYASFLSEPTSITVDESEPVAGIHGVVTVKHTFPYPGYDTAGGSGIERLPVRESEFMPADDYIPGELIVGFSWSVGIQAARTALVDKGIEVLAGNNPLNAVLVKVPAGDEHRMRAELEGMMGVIYVEPNYRVHTLGRVPNDPHYGKQWHYPLIRLPQAWNITRGASWVRVGVLDTGVDAAHPDLAGCIDTARGYNFIDDNNDTTDHNAHGTHVAGTIISVTDNNQGVAGIMWSGEVLPVKVLDDTGSGSFWALGEGILYAAGLMDEPYNPQPVHVINMSLGGVNYSEYAEAAVQAAAEAGVILVAAAGNSGYKVSYPALFPEVIAVGAVDYNYPHPPRQTFYSAYVPEIDLVAPGGDTGRDSDSDGYVDGVLSTAFERNTPLATREYGYYLQQGTSMASPHVAGVAGLMLAAGIPSGNIRSVLQTTAMDLNAAHGEGMEPSFFFDPDPPENGEGVYGAGLLNAYWAVCGVDEARVLIGSKTGNVINAVAELSLSPKGGAYHFTSVPAGSYHVFAWIDVRETGTIDTGDYFAQSQLINFQEGHAYTINLTLAEIVD